MENSVIRGCERGFAIGVFRAMSWRLSLRAEYARFLIREQAKLRPPD
jgi:hypothetical protein